MNGSASSSTETGGTNVTCVGISVAVWSPIEVR